MAITSKVEICNLALGYLGNYGSLASIDTPKSPKELTFAAWYDVCRRALLKTVMPNFSLRRDVLAPVIETNYTGYANVYPKPAGCLKVLGIGEVEDKENNYAVEANAAGIERIYTNEDYPAGLPIRFVGDAEDVNLMTDDFKLLLAYFLSDNTCMEITQDPQKSLAITQKLPIKMATFSGMSAQENMPIRKSVSNYRKARYNGFPGPDTNARKR